MLLEESCCLQAVGQFQASRDEAGIAQRVPSAFGSAGGVRCADIGLQLTRNAL